MGLEIILTLQLNPHSQAPKIKICQHSKVFSIRIAVENLHKLLIIFIKRSAVNSRTCQKTVNRQNVGLNLIHEYWRRDTKLSKHAHCTMPVLCQYEFYNDVNWLSAAMRQLPDIDSSAARFSFLWVITCSGHTAIYTCIESHVAWRVA